MTQEPQKSNTVLIFIAIIGVVGTIAGATIVAIGNYNVEKFRQQAELTRIALVYIATQGGATQVSMASTISAPTNTPYPTNELQPTYTPYPTYTSIPFPTIPPTPSISLPFSDNFDNGMKSEWKVIQGQPLIVDGRLSSTGSSNEKAVLEIGDSFTNYTAEFDFELLPNSHYMGFIIGRQIRYTGTDYCCNLWESFSGGQWEYIADGAPNGTGRNGHAQVVVSGNTYSLFINGQMVSKITYGMPSSGPFAIIVDYRAFIDNLIITAN